MSEDGHELAQPLRPYIHNHHNNPAENAIKTKNYEHHPCLPLSEFKITHPPSMESQIRKLRISMDNWKPIILNAYNVLLWEKHWHPSALIGGSTVLFTLLWLCDPNILTVISLLGLFATMCDYVVPLVVSSFYKHEITEAEQRLYEDICKNIVLYKTKFELLLTSYFKLKVTNPKMYFTITMATLLALAWIGAAFNNLLLLYLITTFVLLYPGLDHNGMLDNWTACVSKIFTELVENAKSKVGHKKIQ